LTPAAKLAKFSFYFVPIFTTETVNSARARQHHEARSGGVILKCGEVAGNSAPRRRSRIFPAPSRQL
jgi:hypothetical protein